MLKKFEFWNFSIFSLIYIFSKDIRLMEHVPGRSINLAMSIRGRSALRAVGLEDEVIKNHGLPMHSRMIHRPDGSTYAMPYGKKGEVRRIFPFSNFSIFEFFNFSDFVELLNFLNFPHPTRRLNRG